MRSRDGRPRDAARPIGVSMRPGATTFARIMRRAPSCATWRPSPPRAAFDVSYEGSPLPGLMPVFSVDYVASSGLIEETSTGVLKEIRAHNPLLFDFVLKRHLRSSGKALWFSR